MGGFFVFGTVRTNHIHLIRCFKFKSAGMNHLLFQELRTKARLSPTDFLHILPLRDFKSSPKKNHHGRVARGRVIIFLKKIGGKPNASGLTR